jgi:hypothetical protein
MRSNKKPIKVHAWKAETHQHYVEPEWCSTRLFQVETFSGQVDDPCCGFGRIPRASIAAGHDTTSSDLVRRGYGGPAQDFLASTWWRDNIVFNPPFNAFQQFAEHALHLARDKVAAIWLVPRLNAAHKWLDGTPLARVWLLTPRPSMPPGHVITARRWLAGGTFAGWCGSGATTASPSCAGSSATSDDCAHHHDRPIAAIPDHGFR